MQFDSLLKATRKGQPSWKPPSRLLALDPGETVGWALFIDGNFYDCGQQEAKEDPAHSIQELFAYTEPTQVVAVAYRDWETDRKSVV